MRFAFMMYWLAIMLVALVVLLPVVRGLHHSVQHIDLAPYSQP
jgi:hypothetical protein